MTPTQESALFFHELGQAITTWAYVELDLARLVAAAASKEERHLTSVGFFSIENFRSKLAYCDDILTEQFHASPAFPRWNKLRSRIESLARKRNRLAHQTVMVYVQSRPGRRHALVNWTADLYRSPNLAAKPRRGFAPPTDAMCVRELTQVRYDFEAVMHSVRNVRSALLGELEPYAASQEVSQKVPTAASLWNNFQGTFK